MDLAAQLRRMPTPVLADAMRGRGVPTGLRSMLPGTRVAGPAFTAKAPPGSVETCLKALEVAPPGAFLVVDGSGYAAGALMGELFARYARRRGLAGAAIDGAVRDTEGIRALEFPVWYRHTCPRAWVNHEVGELGSSASIGGCIVQSGDWVVADDDGLAIVPAAQAADIIAAAEARLAAEEDIARRIDAGERLVDILGLRERLGL